MQGKKWHPSQHLGVVAIEKAAFKSPSTTVASFISQFWSDNTEMNLLKLTIEISI